MAQAQSCGKIPIILTHASYRRATPSERWHQSSCNIAPDSSFNVPSKTEYRGNFIRRRPSMLSATSCTAPRKSFRVLKQQDSLAGWEKDPRVIIISTGENEAAPGNFHPADKNKWNPPQLGKKQPLPQNAHQTPSRRLMISYLMMSTEQRRGVQLHSELEASP